MAADHRSALPRVPGIPWWAAAIVAVVVTALGVAYDAGSGSDALGAVFATCYVLGCVAAVVAVRQSGIFTAVIQPPLILFVAVPFAYFVITGSTFTGIKDTLINCGYPLIERFPLMFFTSATVLLIGMIRWYLGAAARRATPKDTDATLDAPEEVPATATPKESGAGTKPRRSSRTATTRAAATAATAGKAAASAMDDESPRAPRRNPRPPGSGAQRSAGAAAGTGTGSRRSRHSRPPETELDEPAGSRPRRRNTLRSIHPPSRGAAHARANRATVTPATVTAIVSPAIVTATVNLGIVGPCLRSTVGMARASDRRSATTGRNAHRGGLGQRTTKRTIPRRATGPTAAMAHTTRCRACVTAGQTKASRGPSTARRRVDPATRRPTPGSTTSRAASTRCAWGGSRAAA